MQNIPYDELSNQLVLEKFAGMCRNRKINCSEIALAQLKSGEFGVSETEDLYASLVVNIDSFNYQCNCFGNCLYSKDVIILFSMTSKRIRNKQTKIITLLKFFKANPNIVTINAKSAVNVFNTDNKDIDTLQKSTVKKKTKPASIETLAKEAKKANSKLSGALKNKPYIVNSYNVDGGCRFTGRTGEVDWQGKSTVSGRLIFSHGPFPHGTNNLSEFFAIVDMLKYLKNKKSNWPIYTDSRNAMIWISKKHANTNDRTILGKEVLAKLNECENWLKTNRYTTKILKWHTSAWGEIPADFGRK